MKPPSLPSSFFVSFFSRSASFDSARIGACGSLDLRLKLKLTKKREAIFELDENLSFLMREDFVLFW